MSTTSLPSIRRHAACGLALLCATLFAAIAPTTAIAQEPPELQIAELRLGFSGAYKLGSWTQAEVVIDGGLEPFTGLVEITARDPEGVPSSTFTPPDRAIAIVPGQTTRARLFVRPGQDGAAIRVRIFDDRGDKRAERNFY